MFELLLMLQLGAHGPCAGVTPGHAEAMEVRARKDADAAIKEAESVRARAPQCAVAHLGYALALFPKMQASSALSKLGLARDYRAALDQAAKLDPSLLRARTELIEYAMHAPAIAGGSVDQAREGIVALSRTHPVEAARLSYQVELKHGERIAALAAAERWANLAPHDVDAVVTLVRRLLAAERHRDADAWLIRLETGASADPRARQAGRYWRSRVRYVGQFELDAALRMMEAYIEAGPPSGDAQLPARGLAQLRLGELLEKMGRCAAARDRMEAARAIDANLPGLNTALTRISSCRAAP
ncbi:MAG: hypothetical protein JNM76_08565 [Betaproteobacteria bacterium]|nr:hypothetical protein [Betaproteobacteria bacterium]